MDPQIEKFFRYMEKAAKAERAQKYAKMWKYVAKAECLPLKTDFQRWTLAYAKAVYSLRYGAEEDLDEATQKLLKLRREARDSYVLYQLAHENYVSLLVSVLHKNYARIQELPEYGELAQELVELVEKEGRRELDGIDLYALAYIMLAQYYGIVGQIVRKETCLAKVWDAAQHAPVVSYYAFCALVTYMDNLQFQAKYQQAWEVCLFLTEKLADGQTGEVCQGDVNYFIVNACNLAIYIGDRALAYRLVEDALREGFVRPWKEPKAADSAIRENMLGVYSCYLGGLVLQQQDCPQKRMEEITEYLARYRRDEGFCQLPPWQRSNYYMACYRRERLARDSHALSSLGQCVQILQEEDFGETDRMPFLLNIIEAIREYRSLRRKEQAAGCVDKLMHKLLEYYAMAEYYQENKQMEAYFGICRISFEIAYQAVGDAASAPKRMEYSLNGKNLLSTAIRFRNQLDMEQMVKREKHADAFPYYSFSQLEERMPEDTAILEFLYMDPDVYKNARIWAEQQGQPRVLEIFVLAKKKGHCGFLSQKIGDDGELVRWVQKLREQMEARGQGSRVLLQKIFARILEPFTALLKGIRHLWICPDQELCNLPFEVVLDRMAKEWLCQDVVYWQSLRDIFQDWGQSNPALQAGTGDCGEEGSGVAAPPNSASRAGTGDCRKEACEKKVCAIGNPAYSLEGDGKVLDSLPKQSSRWIREQIVPLPFSGYEAGKVARMLQGSCYTHRSATKAKVSPGYRYLHIATHGYSNQQGNDSWYESSLAFSGIADYLGTGVEDPECGNGMLTAEEISRMRLDGTEVAVLSACNSGNSLLTSLRQQTGLHVAFGIAGVKYIIAALWSADDLAAAVFMVYFYRALSEGFGVPEAVSVSRRRLRMVTAREILQMMEADGGLLPPEAHGVFSALGEMPADYHLYDNPAYWGNFICYETMM